MVEPIPLRPLKASPFRKAGRRVKALPAAFVADLAADWHQHGPQVLARVRQLDPVGYLRTVGAIAQHLMPRPPSPPVAYAAPETSSIEKAMWSPRRRLDGMAARLAAAILELGDRNPAALSDEELRAAWGPELTSYYVNRIRRRP